MLFIYPVCISQPNKKDDTALDSSPTVPFPPLAKWSQKMSKRSKLETSCSIRATVWILCCILSRWHGVALLSWKFGVQRPVFRTQWNSLLSTTIFCQVKRLATRSDPPVPHLREGWLNYSPYLKTNKYYFNRREWLQSTEASGFFITFLLPTI